MEFIVCRKGFVDDMRGGGETELSDADNEAAENVAAFVRDSRRFGGKGGGGFFNDIF